MSLTRTYKLDVVPGGVPLVINVNQYDDDFTLKFELYSSVGTLSVASGAKAMVRGLKLDGTVYSENASIASGVVTVKGNKQMTAVAGDQKFELKVTASSKDLYTANFILRVEKSVADIDSIASDSVLRELAPFAGDAEAIIAAGQAVEALDLQNIIETEAARQQAEAQRVSETAAKIAEVDSKINETVETIRSATSADVAAANTAASNASTSATNAASSATTAKASENALAAIKAVFDTASGAGLHNSIFRGKNLGTSLTSAQSEAIKAGTFDDIWVGDYWVIGDVTYRIMGLDYFYMTSWPRVDQHHAVVVPDRCMYKAKMNDTKDTSTGYVGSTMRTTGLSQAKATINSAFGSHIYKHNIYLPSAYNGTNVTANVFEEVDIELMTEIMVYGTQITVGGKTNALSEKTQLPGMRLETQYIGDAGTHMWLRDVVGDGYYACMWSAEPGVSSATGELGVRPYFLVN